MAENNDELKMINHLLDVEKDANYDLVNAAVATAEEEIVKTAENTTLYTQTTIDAVTEALGEVVTGRKITAQAEVDGWATAINNAVGALEKNPASYDELNSAKAAAIAKRDTKVSVRGNQEYQYQDR